MSAVKIQISEIIVNERIRSPIVDKDSEIFKALKESINKHGIIVPLRVSGKFIEFTNDIEFTLIDGLQRLEVAKDLGITEVLAFVEMNH